MAPLSSVSIGSHQRTAAEGLQTVWLIAQEIQKVPRLRLKILSHPLSLKQGNRKRELKSGRQKEPLDLRNHSTEGTK